MLAKIKALPWTPMLLLALLISSLMNFVAMRNVRRELESGGWSQHYDSSDLSEKLDGVNNQLGEISDSVQNLEACSKEIRPVWCKH